MRNKAFLTLLLLVALGGGFFIWKKVRQDSGPRISHESYLPRWDAARAASYLDDREMWWQKWPPARRAHGTFCVSCHTALPYALARPLLQQAMGQTAVAALEQELIENIEARVTQWAQIPPYYSDRAGPGKAAQSRATEAVLNAVILASSDTRAGHLRPVTRMAFDEAWALQQSTGPSSGGWQWQDFGLAPWESADSAYQGAALLAEKVESAPDGYATEPGTVPYLNRLWDYLERGYPQQSVMNQLYVLWASTRSSQPLTPKRRETLFKTIRSLQQGDGGWSLARIDTAPNLETWHWMRRQLKFALHPPLSDGCATGLVIFVLQQAGINRHDPMVRRGEQWLMEHQRPDGSWRADSLNAKRDPESGVGRFMSDAATGYAVMALETAQ